jgi:hypothetical protein
MHIRQIRYSFRHETGEAAVIWREAEIRIENLFHLFIFSMDFFREVFIIDARLKQSEGQIRFCFTVERRLGHEKNYFFADHRGFYRWVHC